MTHLGQHLDVVPLVADGQYGAQRDPEPASKPADGSTLRNPRRGELEEARMADGHGGHAAEPLASEWCQLGRQGWLARGEDLGDRMPDRVDEVAGQLRVAADERAVLVGPRIVEPDDQALEVVEMWVEPAFARPRHDLASDRGTHRRVDEQATEPVRTGGGHLANERTLVADDRRIELELTREMHGA
jgi:hypothetical protein